MTDEEIKETINNMSEQELNEYIFFALKEMTKKCEKQQAEIRQYEKTLQDQIIKGCEIELALKEVIKKKDKIIDEMAKYISETDIEEDICMKNVANTELCNEEYSNCIECIKKYFERMIENE